MSRPALTSTAALFAAVLTFTAAPLQAATDLWWDTAYAQRFNIAVNTGPGVPDRGYAGYTARIAALDTAALIAAGELQSDCSDLRVLFYDGLAWIELPRHVIDCNSVQTDIRFMLSADIAASDLDDNYYLYHNNAAPGALPPMNETNVYLWYDDGSSNRIGSYTRGRIDPWHGTGWDDSLSYVGAGYYRYDNGDNFSSGYRREVGERDVYIEAEFFHQRCYPLNITTGLMVRGSISSGTGGSENSDNYYASNRGEFPNVGPGSACTAGGYTHDGSIIKNNRQNIVVTGTNPPDVQRNTWRRQGLAAWSAGPTNLAYWDEDLSGSWAALGYPAGSNLQVAGSDGSDENANRGFVAFMTAQDRARVRNILVRRYIATEPTLILTAETQSPNLLLTKSVLTVYDPVNLTNDAKAIPGAWIEYSLTAANSGAGSADADSLAVTDPLAANVALFVGDLGAPNSGPVVFTDGAGTSASGLSYVYGGPGDAGDSLQFSTDGVDFGYTPSPDVDGFDPAIRFVRIRPIGSFAAANGGSNREFSLRFRVRVQ
ncbi:MAG: hypothetical protein AAGE85_03000 [Pseudomonadota bacterium]